MNMTIVLVSRAPMELLLVCLLLVVLSVGNQFNLAEGRASDEVAEQLVDESQDLTSERLEKIVRVLGAEMSQMMDSKLGESIELAEKVAKKREELGVEKTASENVRNVDLDRLKGVKSDASRDIKTRIELVGDQSGALPQMSLGKRAGSFLSQVSDRLQSAGSYIGDKIHSLSNFVAPKVPKGIRHLFRWPTFLRFKIRYNKVYKSMREEIYRQMLYLRAHVAVGVQHIRFFLGLDKHLLGATQYADWSHKEIQEKLNNKLAERSPLDADPSAAGELDDSYKRKLEQLSGEGKNIFGVPMNMFSSKSGKNDKEDPELGLKRSHRFKRNADQDMEYEDALDELDENEDEDFDMDMDHFGPMLQRVATVSVDEDDDMDIDEERLVEEFANAQMGDLDAISVSVKEALGPQGEAGKTEQASFNPYAEEVNPNDIPEEVGDDFVPIDLRQTGCIIRPENQGPCGACYAYAINAAAAYYNCMENYHNNEKIVRYNPLFTAECGRYLTPPDVSPFIKGCEGGRMSKAFVFTQLVGVQRYADYSISKQSVGGQALQGHCAYPRPQQLDMSFSELSHEVPFYMKSRFINLKLNEIDLHLRTVGPVFINLRTFKDFELMQAGIYGGIEECDGNQFGVHSMLIVGHEKDFFNRDYWILWNSYGVNWAERGFIRLYTRSLKRFFMYGGGLQAIQF